MASRNDVLIKFRADASQLVSETDTVIQQFQRLNEILQRQGRKGFSDIDLSNVSTQAREGAQRVQELIQKLEVLNQIRQRGAGTRGGIPISPEEQAVTGIDPKFATGATRTQIAEAERAVQAEINQLLVQRADLFARISAETSKNKEAAEGLLAISTQEQFVKQKIAALTSREFEEKLFADRIQNLQSTIDQLIQAQAALRRQSSEQVGQMRGGRTDRAIKDSIAEEESAQQRLNTIMRQSQGIQSRLNEARKQGVVDTLKLEEQLAQVLRRQEAAQERVNNAQAATTQARAQQGANVDVTGVRQLDDQLTAEIARIQELLVRALSGGVKTFAPELGKIQQELLANLRITERTEEVERNKIALLERARRLQAGLNADLEEAQQFSEASINEKQLANLPALERTLFTAFDDVGRRFRTALQFAISGAIIYSAQRLAREFIQAAIEVERAFADIESALEFDLADEGLVRGTSAFNSQVEAIRRNVLQLANEFNTLPSEANEAAFKMIARFNDTETALSAVRAQFLATKISTIDQDEAIRALSATAEGFASSVLEVNNSMSLQERLMQRETVAAEAYGAALDEAVLIQQRFGVEVEDTLEGTARMAETFRQLGFTRQETEATVAAVSRQLGQSGTNVAERLNRAFGQITQPETRDALLELAAASDDLNLSIADFSDGATVVEKLDRQFAELERRDPQVANQLRDIIGQRRETEVVAAFFGTADLRREIESALGGAAGAAERRFSFLEATLEERIASIITQFESLAQNFERLELFGPISAALTVLDGVLSTVNAILQGFIDIFQRIDDIGSSINLKLGSALKGVLVTALSLYGILRSAAAAVTVISVTRSGAAALRGRAADAAASGAGGALAALAPLLAGVGSASREAGGGLRGVAAMALTVVGALRAAAVAAANWTGNMLLGLPGIGRGFTRLSSAAGLSAGALGGLALGIGAAVFAIANFVSEGKRAIEGMREFNLIPQRAEIDTRRQGRIEPFESAADREIFQLRRELDLQLQLQQENTRGFMSTLLTGLFPIFDETTRNEIGLGSALGATARGLIGAGGIDQELIAFSDEWWEAQIQESEDAWIQAQLRAVRGSLGDLSGQSQTGGRGSRVRFVGEELAGVERQFAEAETPEELALAKVALDRLLANHEDLLYDMGQTYEAIETSITALQNKIAETQRSISLGHVAEAAAPDLFFGFAEEARAAAELLAASDSANTAETIAQIAEYNEIADDSILAGIDARRALFQRERSRMDLIKDPAVRMDAMLRSLNQELQFVRDSGAVGGSAVELDLLDEIARTRAETAEDARDTAAEIARRKIGLARTLAEWIAAVETLIAILQDSIPQVPQVNAFTGFVTGTEADPTAASEAADQIQELRNQLTDRLNNEAVTLAEAQARLAGPIKSNLQGIEARIRGLRVRISQGFFSPGEAMAAQVELAEAIADRIEAEAESVASWIRLQAGVGDSMRSLQAELTIAAKQLEITANLYGRQSAQYLALKLSQINLQQQLIAAQLELEDLNRRLGSDVTNSFEQAQLDLVEIMRRMSQLDLGPLEKARLELEKRNAEAAAEKAFFDDRLFQLRFDFETGKIGTEAYTAALRRLLDNVDTSTRQGKEIFLEISNLLDSLTEDVSDFQFNVPTSIRLPTIFEIRRALAADQLGVNYMDNREQNITIEVSSTVELDEAFASLDNFLGTSSTLQFQRQASGGATITPGGF